MNCVHNIVKEWVKLCDDKIYTIRKAVVVSPSLCIGLQYLSCTRASAFSSLVRYKYTGKVSLLCAEREDNYAKFNSDFIPK